MSLIKKIEKYFKKGLQENNLEKLLDYKMEVEDNKERIDEIDKIIASLELEKKELKYRIKESESLAKKEFENLFDYSNKQEEEKIYTSSFMYEVKNEKDIIINYEVFVSKPSEISEKIDFKSDTLIEEKSDSFVSEKLVKSDTIENIEIPDFIKNRKKEYKERVYWWTSWKESVEDFIDTIEKTEEEKLESLVTFLNN